MVYLTKIIIYSTQNAPRYNFLEVFEPKYDDTNVYFWMYDFDSKEFKPAGTFDVKGLADLFYLATMKDKVAILTNIDDDMIRNSNHSIFRF